MNPSFRRFVDSNRRQWIQAGAFNVLGLSLPSWMALQAQTGNLRKSKASSVLLLVEHGGMSHVDTWDPKPEAPAEHRTPFDLVPTQTPGVYFTKLLSRTARISDKLAVIRSMRHIKRVNDHPGGMQFMLSGEAPGGPVEMPDMGSVASYLLGTKGKHLPAYVQLPATSEMAHMTRVGFLPRQHGVFKAIAHDASDPDWHMECLQRNPEFTESRWNDRRQLLASVNRNRALAADREASALDEFHAEAANMLFSPHAARAFNLATESADTREQYGPGHRGACYLLGRKLIEAGVRFVTIDVRWPLTPETPKGIDLNWDHHDFIYAKDTCELPGAGGGGAGRYGIGHWVMAGSLDRAFSALITDLDQRGLLDQTLVCLLTEFGRTPKVNPQQGRDHWPDAYSIVMAGAGIRGGQVIGATDQQGAFVRESPHSPEDVAATIYDSLGIDLGKPLYTPDQRPIYLAHQGKPIKTLF